MILSDLSKVSACIDCWNMRFCLHRGRFHCFEEAVASCNRSTGGTELLLSSWETTVEVDTANRNSEIKVDPDVEEDLRGLLKMADSTGSGRSLCSAEHVKDAFSF